MTNKDKLIIAQRPNRPIVVAGLAWLAIRVSEDHLVGVWVLETVFFTAILYWSFLEVVDGANWFRRFLGLTVGTINIWGLIERLI